MQNKRYFFECVPNIFSKITRFLPWLEDIFHLPTCRRNSAMWHWTGGRQRQCSVALSNFCPIGNIFLHLSSLFHLFDQFQMSYLSSSVVTTSMFIAHHSSNYCFPVCFPSFQAVDPGSARFWWNGLHCWDFDTKFLLA